MQDKTAPAAATTASRCADEVRIAHVSLEPISWTRMHNAQSYVGTMGSGWGDGVGWRRHTVMFERECIFPSIRPGSALCLPLALPGTLRSAISGPKLLRSHGSADRSAC